jgi:uncharacterized repeat protein (TIGR03803 family)
MKSSILRTILVVTTLPTRLFTFESGRGCKAGPARKISLSKMGCMVFAFCAATAIISPAQTKLTWVYSFTGNPGANPGFGNLVQGLDGNLYGTTEVSVGTEGTVFKISTAGKLKTLYVFCTEGEPCLEGAKPLGGLAMASNGMFYGTASLGGSPGDGTVFQISSAGKFKWLYDFGTTTNGSEPWAPPIPAANGLLYGSTALGGSKNYGTLYEMTTAGTNASAVSFTGPNGIYPYGRLIQAKNGTLYGTTSQLTSGNGTVFAVTENEGFKTLHKFTGARGGGFPTGGLVQASSGTFYGTTDSGGAQITGGTVFSITAAGAFKTLYSFCAKPNCTDGAHPMASLIQASDGNLYGTTYNGGTNTNSCNAGCGTIFRITPTGTLTTVYNFCSQTECTDGYYPESGLVQATNGSFYGTTFYGGKSGSAGTVYSLSLGLAPFVKVLPALGKAGATAMILGDNLTGTTKVSFNGIPAAFTVVSDTEITATVPTGGATGMIEVTTPSSTLKSNVAFEVTP